MSNSITSLREEDVREQEGQTPPEAESSFGDILTQFEQSQALEALALANAEKDAARSSGEKGGARSGADRGGEKSSENRVVSARVVTTSDGIVFFDIGQKTEGILPADILRDEQGLIELKAGDVVKVTVGQRNEEGLFELSLIHVDRPKDWTGLQKAFDEKLNISGVVTGVVKGGLSVDVGVRAFMPASRSGARDVPEMQTLVGKEIACRVIKLDTEKEDVVVDRRVVLEEERALAKDARFTELQVGMVVPGTVRSLLDYGAFIDIGGVDGMLHVADISHGRVNKPADALTVGQQLEVKILKVDVAKRRVSLGLKQLQADPWSTAGERYNVGDRVKGTVARVTDFGAFVELEPGLDGLIHLSEMSWSKKVRKPSDAVNPGDVVEVAILGVNPGEKRISLGLKQIQGDPWEEIAQKFPVGSTVEGKVTQLKQFGAFVQVSEEVEGMIHVGDIVHDKRINHPQDELKVGQTVKALVLECDKDKRRLRLGLKQLIPTALDEYIAEQKEGEVVTGRISDLKGNKVTVELGEGVFGTFNMAPQEQKTEQRTASVDVSALSSMLASRWKGGGSGASSAAPGESAPKKDTPKVGQVRTFKIVKLDVEKKKIEVELAS